MAKARGSIWLLALFGLAIFLCLMSFHTSPLYNVCSKAPIFQGEALSGIDATGNCNCSVVYGFEDQKPLNPSFSCVCLPRDPVDCPQDEVRELEKEVVKEKRPDPEAVQTGPVYVEGRAWHYPARFPLCSMDACFNYSKCDNADDLLIYSYDLPSTPVRYFSRINESKWHTNDPGQACLFFVYLDSSSPWPPHPSTLPYWNGGLNHVLIIFADKWAQKGPPQESIGFASVMASDIHETIYRAGFDISIPLPGNHHMRELQSVKPFERKYLATFRGLRYLGHSGEAVFRSRDSFREMHNGEDVIVATSCKHFINDLNREKEPALGIHCDEDEAIHANQSFTDLMNTTFGLVPAGVQPSSYRFIEVLSAGSIPILIADNYVKPFDALIQWHRCLLQFPTTEMHRIIPVIRALKKEEVIKRQENCLQIYREFLSDDDALLETTVRALKARFLGAFPNFNEVRR